MKSRNFYASFALFGLVGLLAWFFCVGAGSRGGQSAVIVTGSSAFSRVSHPDLKPWWNPDKNTAPPTNAWWTNLVLGSTTPAVVTPYAVRLRGEDGVVDVNYGYPRRVATAKMVSDPFFADLSLGCASSSRSATLTAYSPLTATFEIPECLHVHFARGSPYVTAEFGGRKHVSLSSESGLTIRADGGDEPHRQDAACSSYQACSGIIGDCCPTSANVFLDCCSSTSPSRAPQVGKRFSLVLGDGSMWRLYSSASVALNVSSSRTAHVHNPDGTAFKGVLRVAYAEDDVAVKTLDSYSGAYAVGSKVTWARRDGDELALDFEWTAKGKGDLIHLALPHHVDSMVDDAAVRVKGLKYTSLKGKLTAYRGSRWTMVESVPRDVMSWFAPRPSTDLDSLKRLVQSDADQVLPRDEDEDALAKAMGVYSAGKRAAKFATLAIVAEAIGLHQEAKEAAEAAMRAVAPWLENSSEAGGSQSLLVYETSFGGVCTAAGLADKNADYGNGWYNDHHFHYGYLIYAAAVSRKILAGEGGSDDDEYNLGEKDVLLASIVADVVNPSSSPYFPALARHKDFYDGHSWASGLFEMNDGRSQESVSEAINCYYAVALYADSRNERDLADFARLLAALEIRAAKTYWHVPRTTKNGVYPSAFSDNNRIVAVVGASDVSADTWFARGSAYAHGINVLPVTPITELLLEPIDYVAAAVDDAERSLEELAETKSEEELSPWSEIRTQMLAVVDPDRAARHILQLADQDDPVILDATQTLSSMMYWATTRPSPNITSPTPGSDDDDDDDEGKPPSIVSDDGSDDEDSPMPEESCAANRKCVNIGLGSGNCCPTAEGIQLWCCDRQ